METLFAFPDESDVLYLRSDDETPSNSEWRTHFNNPVNMATCFTFNKGTFRYGTKAGRLPAIRFVSTHGVEVMWVFSAVPVRDAQFNELQVHYETPT